MRLITIISTLLLLGASGCDGNVKIADSDVGNNEKKRYDNPLTGQFEFSLKTREVLAKALHTDKDEIIETYVCYPPNLYIRDLFTGELIPDTLHISRPVDLYSAKPFGHHRSIVVITYGDEFTIIDTMRLSYEEVLSEIIKYFEMHPDIDERLRPYIVQKITSRWVSNHCGYIDSGKWLRWFDGEDYPEDSIVKIYRDLLVGRIR